MEVHRGEVFYADLSPVVGSEQGGVRPVLIIQNEIGNKHSPTVIAAAITSRQDKNRLPTHIGVRADRCGLAKDSIILTEQIRTLDKRRLRERAGKIPPEDMHRVDEALGVSMGLVPQPAPVQCLGHLLQDAGPVVVQDQAVPHLPDQVPVVGDAQLGQTGVHRGLGHGGEGVLPVRRAEGVGVIVGEIHSASR